MKKTLFIISLSFLCLAAHAQLKWYSITKRDIVLYSCMAVAGTADGFNQAIIHHDYGKGISFIDYETSWKRKYRNADINDYRPAYIGSKSWLVWTTDAYHLSRTVDHTATIGGIVIASTSDLKQYHKKDRWKVLAIKRGIVPLVIRGIFFSAFYNKLGYERR
ncbi:hypothetical protein [Ferruginibacter sp. HRS2-29]|uniref:hypothetical protein n=1 Tax=Ferruginibacter sp. HRS2-29 TaxID=2487334 RepID=UPI0020CF1376|nr:hypothetical protein [Ferruginibacter sp. HRS2-29]MCP9750363.1 hypothetical protein [Ferruginibacter sp. HRS2-29]